MSPWNVTRSSSLVILAQTFCWEVNGKWGSRDWERRRLLMRWTRREVKKGQKEFCWYVVSSQIIMEWMNNRNSGEVWSQKHVCMKLDRFEEDYYSWRKLLKQDCGEGRGCSKKKRWKVHLEQEGSLSLDTWRRGKVWMWLVSKEEMLPNSGGVIQNNWTYICNEVHS